MQCDDRREGNQLKRGAHLCAGQFPVSTGVGDRKKSGALLTPCPSRVVVIIVVVVVVVLVVVLVVIVVVLVVVVVSNNSSSSSSSRSRITVKDAPVYVHVAYLFMRASIYAQIFNARSRLSLHVLLTN